MENKKHSIKLSKALYDEAKRVYVTYDKADESGVYNTIYLPLPKQQSLDINAYLIEQSDEFEKLARNMGRKISKERKIKRKNQVARL